MLGGGIVGIILWVTLVVLGWVYYSKMMKDSDDYSTKTADTSLAMAIVGILIPLYEVIPILLYYNAKQECDSSDAVSTMKRPSKKVRFQNPQQKTFHMGLV